MVTKLGVLIYKQGYIALAISAALGILRQNMNPPEPELIGVDEDYFGNYGVCDSIDNLLLKCPMLISSERKFVITLTSVKKKINLLKGGGVGIKAGVYRGDVSTM